MIKLALLVLGLNAMDALMDIFTMEQLASHAQLLAPHAQMEIVIQQ